MIGQKAETIINSAYELSKKTEFHKCLGPGAGDKRTQVFMHELQKIILEKYQTDYSEKQICGNNSLAVDFYIPEEKTIIEIALGLPNPNTEFEKDLLKAIISKELGNKISKLIFISRPGAKKKCNQPGRKAFIEWMKNNHEIYIDIYELFGEPRKRNRKRND